MDEKPESIIDRIEASRKERVRLTESMRQEVGENQKKANEAIDKINPPPREPKFKQGDFVRHQDKPWEIAGFVGGDLGFLYRLRGENDKTKNASENELELWEK